MKLLVTGGAGCIGSELAEVLLRRGHDVVVLDNLSSGKLEHIESSLASPRFRFVQGDLLDPAALDSAMTGIDFVYHLAANPDVKFAPGDPTDKDLRQNVLATYNVLDTMRRHQVQGIAFASTSAVYGIPQILPIPEHHVTRPISLYGASKLSCEAMIGAFQNLFGMRGYIFRFANIVGARSRRYGGTVISDFVRKLRSDPTRLQILGDGQQSKSYLLVTDCVNAMLHAIEHAPEPLAIYNLGCNDWISVTRIADMITHELGLSGVEYEYSGTSGGWPGDVPRFVLDVTAINSLGWRATYSSEEAIAIAIRTHVGNQIPCKP